MLVILSVSNLECDLMKLIIVGVSSVGKIQLEVRY